MSGEEAKPSVCDDSDHKETTPGEGYIVGIGASAGGYEAIESFFRKMPHDSGLSFVIVQHLSPDFKSLMVELLSKHTKMPIQRVEDGMIVEPGSIYLIPPKKKMTLANGRLYLSEMDPSIVPNLPINDFFRSLAEEKKEKAIGIILSGTGSDGTLGIREIKGYGGIVIVQDPTTSKFDGMPNSALSTGMVDYQKSPGEMPEVLLNYVKHIDITKSDTTKLIKGKRVDALTSIFKVLSRTMNVDFSQYKPNTIIRRVEKRMSINQIEKIDDYIMFLRSSTFEARSLYRELLIGVTGFFRDSEAFNKMEHEIIPKVLKNRKVNSPVRVWVSGCSTGEEAYSLAILFAEVMDRMKINTNVKIFATDIDQTSLEYASNGLYPDSILGEIPDGIAKKYFMKDGSNLQINERIRSMVIFASHNVLMDPPFNRMDLVSCRNLLIYFQPEAQKKVLQSYHFAMNAG